MLPYEFTEDAEEDLRGIIDYTMENYGTDKVDEYVSRLEECAENMAYGTGHFKEINMRGRSVRIKHCRHHYIFGVIRSDGRPMLIVAIFYERMNLMQRLRGRLPA